ncbi:efflux RND transporter periplasmic adaptor subunit [bacterium]|nr:efflux RND transporter periplasmic adaptor subunit [bacterium]
MRPRNFAWLFLLGLLSMTAPALAHGGEAHDEPPAAPASATTQATVASYAESESFELTLKSPPLAAKRHETIKLLLADYQTNQPIEGATLELEFSGPSTVTTNATPTAEKGIYLASLELPEPGSYQLVASITHGDQADLLTVDEIQVASAASGTGAPSRTPLLAGLGALAVLGAGGLLLARRRFGPTAVAGLLTITLPLGMANEVRAHAGHDHEEAMAAPVAVGAPIPLAKESQFLLGIRTVPAAERQVAQRTTLLGRLEPPTRQIVALHAPQAGRIATREVADVGDRVRKGQVLAVVEQVLSTSEQIQLASERLKYQSELTQLEASISQAEQDVAKTRADHQRALKLRDIVAGKSLVDAEISLRKAEDALKGLKGQRDRYARLAPPSLEAARRFPIVAPFDGVVAEAHATFGEQVEPSKLLYRVVDPRTLWMVADVYERDLAKVSRAKRGVLTVEALPGEKFQARLSSMGTLLDEQTRTLKARFLVDNAQDKLKGGMFGRLAVEVGGNARVTAVPASALAELNGKSVVFVRVSPETFAAREVVPGSSDGGWVALEGVKAGERVVTEGVYQLKSTAEKGPARR